MKANFKVPPAAFLTLLVLALVMASVQVTARVALDAGTGVATTLVCRSVLTAFGMVLLLTLTGTQIRISSRQRLALPTIGILIGIQSICLLAAVARMPVALALLAFNAYPIWIAVWNKLLFGRNPDRCALLVMPLILLGLALALDVSGAASGLGARAQWASMGSGVVLAVSAGALYGLALLVTERETKGLDGRVRSAAMLGVAAVVGLVMVVQQGGLELPRGSIGWMGLVSSSLLYGLGLTTVFAVLPRMGVAGNSPIMSVEPIFTLLLAWAFLEQGLQPLQVLGAVLVVAAVAWLGLRPSHPGQPLIALPAVPKAP